jgi:poly(U)-binding-splicing factor PUF60
MWTGWSSLQGDQTEDEAALDDILVKIFVEFSKYAGTLFYYITPLIRIKSLFVLISEAIGARDALNGRYFGGRLVRAEIYEQSLYDHNDFSN